MNIMPFSDNLESILKSAADAEFSDLATGVTLRDVSAFEKQLRDAEAVRPALRSFEDQIEMIDAPGRSGGARPRLRSEHLPADAWRPGVDPIDKGLPTSDDALAKSANSNKRAALLDYLKRQVAAGTDPSEIIARAERSDPHTAAMLREIVANEL